MVDDSVVELVDTMTGMANMIGLVVKWTIAAGFGIVVGYWATYLWSRRKHD